MSEKPFDLLFTLGLSPLHTAFPGFTLQGELFPSQAIVKAVQPCSDVGYESYKVHRRGPSPSEAGQFSEPTRIGLAAVQRSTFQSIASMFVIHVIYLPQRPFMHISSQGSAGIHYPYCCLTG